MIVGRKPFAGKGDLSSGNCDDVFMRIFIRGSVHHRRIRKKRWGKGKDKGLKPKGQPC